MAQMMADLTSTEPNWALTTAEMRAHYSAQMLDW
eukprot:CAMPEP_0113397000 /NCGR_PEP_ID=MMETSP0013_2-20120614/14123_1 /TAXON_ID=2843 ORGANISM="Skeletonema costatum, Strain 1716" /NCGR_SAMPLE_ID=MMETSP0013_2 /ASSEMBLY_ACC=CAM_ASM_000158 /LENGTH=33 /DNA_ID=CAMNT_0000281507 /DNA_START=60 /DNA_END=161 /DNA_ORIENTATION=- /assembly_acc=CAM_ASM_000158